MSETVIVALISAGAAVLTSVTALILNYRGFATIDSRISSLESTMNARMNTLDNRVTSFENRVDQRLGEMQADLKEFYKELARHDTDIARLKDHTGLK
ncbi:MAG: hypothetical protein JO336_23495 [Acidobacteriia bacterium]|nr:hypothetical protein [Terriglobia bacterium]